MKKYLLKTSALSIILFLFILGLSFCANGYTDAYYIRFTTPKQKNLILGTSRAAQGILPHILKQETGINFYNFSFTIGHSPYGKIYLDAIKRKLDTTNFNQTFILSITPWSICSKSKKPNNAKQFREVNQILDRTEDVTSNPNFEYLYKNLSGNYYDILIKNITSKHYLHQNGWLEINVPMNPKKIKKRTFKKTQAYLNKNLPIYKFSSLRLNYLIKTIKYLNKYGKVYLVRLPIGNEMLDIENKLLPNIDNLLKPIIPLSMGYFDFTKSINHKDFKFIDGSHLHKSSGEELTKIIGEWIQSN